MYPFSAIKKYIDSKDQRSIESLKNSIYMLIIKIMSMGISFLYVPLLIHQLDTTNYGIWLTLTSIISWCSFLDIGLGHGLRNLLAKAIAQNEQKRIKSLVGTSYAILGCVIIILIPLTLIIFPLFNWARILNAPDSMNKELLYLAIIVTICFFLQFVLNLIKSILFAIQKPALSSFITFISQFTAFLIVYILSLQQTNYSLITYGGIISLVPVITTLLNTIQLFRTKLKSMSFSIKDIDFSLTSSLFNLGIKFFFIQLTAIMLFQTNNIILTHVAGPEKVTDFNISYKYIGITSMIFTIIITPIWSATTDAYYRKDYDWIKQTIKRLKKIFLLMTISGILLVLISKWIYHIWIGNQIQVDYGVQILVLLYFTASMWCGIYCNILNGIGKVKLQFIITFIEAIAHIPLAILLGRIYGIYGVLASMFLMTFINTIWEPIQIKKLLTNKAKGIWNS
ncbi:oligosaccharide flippase family protein [uncultured Mediterranea sp.]|uniref:lipopolysaccharide biosynthesis protein n=1 Tax=uncultured Mediterranea sp. TaxID=1926662 RepID=UPI0027D9B643|nr:oligosaccharide flippase family protein [uncultured Mediterranea sp.]